MPARTRITTLGDLVRELAHWGSLPWVGLGSTTARQVGFPGCAPPERLTFGLVTQRSPRLTDRRSRNTWSTRYTFVSSAQMRGALGTGQYKSQ